MTDLAKLALYGHRAVRRDKGEYAPCPMELASDGAMRVEIVRTVNGNSTAVTSMPEVDIGNWRTLAKLGAVEATASGGAATLYAGAAAFTDGRLLLVNTYAGQIAVDVAVTGESTFYLAKGLVLPASRQWVFEPFGLPEGDGIYVTVGGSSSQSVSAWLFGVAL